MGTALKTFEVAHERAQKILLMAAAITDHRSRRISDSWSEKFKKFMSWPLRHKIERVDSHDAIIILKDNSSLCRKDFAQESTDDLLRAVLVMGVSAVDAYFHAKVLKYIVSHSKNSGAESSLMKETITVADFVRSKRMKRPNAALSAAFQRKLSFQSLQRPDNISKAVSLIGVKKFWDKIEGEIDIPSEKVKKQLSDIVKRRNQIAHEGDLSQSRKTRNKSRKITKQYVRSSLDFLNNLVHASDEVINANKVT